MWEWASNKNPAPRILTPPPLVWYSWIRHWQHGVIHKHTKQYGACSSKSNNNNNNNNKSALYGQKEKRYSTTQHCTDTKQNNIYLYKSNKNKSALYGHTEKRYSTRHKPLKYNVIQTHTKQCTTRTSRYTDTQTMLNWINLNNTSLNISLNKLPHTSRSVYQTHKNDTVQHGFIQTRTSTIHVCTIKTVLYRHTQDDAVHYSVIHPKRTEYNTSLFKHTPNNTVKNSVIYRQSDTTAA